MKHSRIKKICVLAVLAALSYVLMLVGRIPVVAFLKYDPKDVIITFAGFLYGPFSAFVVSLVVSHIEMFTISPIQVPQDRNSDFEPQVVPKYKKNISEIEGKIIAMYARGMSVTQVSEQIKDIYGFEVSEGMVTAITNKLLPEIEAWQKRPLSSVYPIVYIDAIVFNMRENNVIRKAAAYVILGINEEGRKEVLSITIGENESA